MPIMNDLASEGLVTKQVVVNVLDSGLNKKAKEDFCYIISKSGLAYFTRLGHICVTGPGSKTLAECVVLGADEKMGTVVVPASEITDSEELGKVVVVSYANDAVNGIYLFSYPELKKGGLLSRFKYLKKEDQYSIKMAGIEKCADNKFGIVFSQYINR